MTSSSLWHGTAALAAFWLVLAGCQPEDPYQDAQHPPTAREQQQATAPVEPGMGSDEGGVAGATSQLPLDQRAAAADPAWSGDTRADYDRAIEDCRQMGGALRNDCIAQVRIGFRAASEGAQNPEEMRQHPVPETDTAGTAIDEEGGG